jgi:Polyketide cyclase / dehydrase and lipid transport
MNTVTKSIDLPCSAPAAWKFLDDGGQWPRWAVRNVLSSRPAGPGRWEIRTPRGTGILQIRSVADHGILDHDFIDAQGKWTVAARVVPASGGSVFMMTLEKPPGMPTDVFARGLAELDQELAKLAQLCPEL